MTIAQLLSAIQGGQYPACEGCPWNPKSTGKAAFGVSCREHGVDWTVQGRAISMLIARDPAGTTPATTGKLCGFCNTRNPTDHSANHGFQLWKAAVSLSESTQDSTRYMKTHYWTNAIMHGVDKDSRMIEARAYCRNILLEQIRLLSPKVIIACGKDAARSLFEGGLISTPWDVFKQEFPKRVFSEQTMLSSDSKVTIFCTYHGSATAVNTHVARLYSEETEILINQRIENLPEKMPAKRFLQQTIRLNGEDKGMRVLLLHWLDIGEAIRRANNR